MTACPLATMGTPAAAFVTFRCKGPSGSIDAWRGTPAILPSGQSDVCHVHEGHWGLMVVGEYWQKCIIMDVMVSRASGGRRVDVLYDPGGNRARRVSPLDVDHAVRAGSTFL